MDLALGFAVHRMKDVRDVEGRPLGEHAASPEVLAGVPMDLMECSYPGSRYKSERPMNVSALKQMTRCWPETQDALCKLRLEYQAFHRLERFPVTSVWCFSQSISVLPSFLIYRKAGALADGGLPALVAVLYKVVAGFNTLAAYLSLSSLGRSEEMALSPEDMFEFAEATDLLVGPKQVCGGPTSLIMEAVEALAGERRPKADTPGLRSVLPDTQTFFTFAREAVAFYLVCLRLAMQREQAMVELRARRDGVGERARAASSHAHLYTHIASETLERVSPAQQQNIVDGLWQLAQTQSTADLGSFEGPRHDDDTRGRYVLAERQAIEALMKIQVPLHRALEQPQQPAAITHDDVTRELGLTPSDIGHE